MLVKLTGTIGAGAVSLFCFTDANTKAHRFTHLSKFTQLAMGAGDGVYIPSPDSPASEPTQLSSHDAVYCRRINNSAKNSQEQDEEFWTML